MGLWGAIAIMLGFSLVVVFIDELLHRRRRRLRAERERAERR